MARNYRQTSETDIAFSGSISNNAQRVCSIEPIDADQAPSAWIEKVKVSLLSDSVNDSFLVYAKSDPSFSGSSTDTITAMSTNGTGSGTVWLNIRRSIKSSASEDDRNDGPVYIYVQTQNQTTGECRCVVEAWGRFLEVTMD